MAGLLSGILGGALQGVGEGLQEQAKMEGLMQREARLAELKHGYDKEMAGVNYGYNAKLEGDKSRYRDAENAASSQRGLLSDEARERLKHKLKMEEDAASGARASAEEEKERQFELRKATATKPMTTNELWNAVVERNSTYEQIDGNPLDTRKVTNWGSVANDFRAHGREDLARFAAGAPDPSSSAWRSLEIPPDLRPPERAASGSPRTAAPSPVTQQPPSQAGTPSSSPPPGTQPSTPQSAAPAAPRDPAQRKVGQVYTAPDGRLIEWTGQGWRPR